MARISTGLLAAGFALSVAAPAFAHDHGGGMPQTYQGTWQGTWQGGWNGAQPMPQVMPYPGRPQLAPDPHTQQMLDRCQRYGKHDTGVGGALIGGAVGGLIGNRVASGDRVVGTVAGAAVGAVAGAAIDKAEDTALDRECAEFFRTYGPPQGNYPGPGYAPQGYPAPGYGPAYGYAPYGYMMVPVMIQSQQKPCVETRTVTYEDVPLRHRYIPRRPVIHDKRVKEKRVYTGS